MHIRQVSSNWYNDMINSDANDTIVLSLSNTEKNHHSNIKNWTHSYLHFEYKTNRKFCTFTYKAKGSDVSERSAKQTTILLLLAPSQLFRWGCDLLLNVNFNLENATLKSYFMLQLELSIKKVESVCRKQKLFFPGIHK